MTEAETRVREAESNSSAEGDYFMFNMECELGFMFATATRETAFDF